MSEIKFTEKTVLSLGSDGNGLMTPADVERMKPYAANQLRTLITLNGKPLRVGDLREGIAAEQIDQGELITIRPNGTIEIVPRTPGGLAAAIERQILGLEPGCGIQVNKDGRLYVDLAGLSLQEGEQPTQEVTIRVTEVSPTEDWDQYPIVHEDTDTPVIIKENGDVVEG